MANPSYEQPLELTEFVFTFYRFPELDSEYPPKTCFHLTYEERRFFGLVNANGLCYLAPESVALEVCPEGFTPLEILQALQFRLLAPIETCTNYR